MSNRLSLSDRFICAAIASGYTSNDEGEVLYPDGTKVPVHKASSGHLRATLYIKGLNDRGYASVLVHRLVAYTRFGEEMFSHRLVRHVNGCPCDNRLGNLALGNHRDNRADIPKEVLSRAAKVNSHLLVERSRKLSDVDITSIRKARLEGHSYAALAKMFNVATMTAYRAVNHISWSSI